MGHGNSDRLYITHATHSSSVGAQNKDRLLAKLPFDCCALTLKPVQNPVCTDQGTVYDLMSIIPFLRCFGSKSFIGCELEQHGTDPKTGQKLCPGDLTQLTFHKNAQGTTYHDPVTFKPFNEHTHIVAIKTSGNVYAYETVQTLNLKPGAWRDLLTDQPFTKKDVITLQDPLNIEGKDLSRFDYVKRDLKFGEEEQVPGINKKAVGAGVERVMKSLEKTQDKGGKGGDQNRKAKGKDLGGQDGVGATVRSTANQTNKDGVVTPYNTSVTSAGRAAASLTSTAAPVHTAIENALWNEEDLMFEAIKKSGSKAYARLITNFGNLNLELFAHIAPKASYNFLQLSSQGRYNNTSFHRLIPGFMLQGGDPTGTGRGGTSCWGKAFEDEFTNRNARKHDERGTLSMANSGPDTNGSQFFLTFRATPHLDGKHTVFGRLVGGEDVLKKIEAVPCDVTDRPLKPVIIKDVAIFEDPFRTYQDKLEKRLAREQATRDEQGSRQKKKDERDKDRTTWFGTELTQAPNSPVSRLQEPKVGVGKYLGGGTNGEDKKRPQAIDFDQQALTTITTTTKKNKKRKGAFGDFSSW
ncbi:BQ2448_1615 [Microbotryum intermedium]|uniref:BQ2448_1615 protein n=1 Tax=Microbotryum intermedium TaxID=269621 RepID=A0A238FDM3_9BASI|nr:BQ2448_1615 [Microbotryum intermedium]